jgi:hypothetical protein
VDAAALPDIDWIVEQPSDYEKAWQRRYAELIGHGVPDEKARLLASELAAGEILAAAQARTGSMAAAGRPPTPKLRMAKGDGYGLLVMGVLSLIIAAMSVSIGGMAIGAGVAAAGWCELDGYRRFMEGRAGSRLRLMGSQLAVLGIAWAYAGWTIIHPEPLSPEISEMLAASGDQASSMQGMVDSLRFLVAAAICAVSLLYQGGLAWYYFAKTKKAG